MPPRRKSAVAGASPLAHTPEPLAADAEAPVGIVRANHGRWHSYTVDGQPVPGVTRITGYFKSGPLADWPANNTAEYAVNNWQTLSDMGAADRLKALYGAQYADRDAAANRGTEVHKVAERLVAGETLAAGVDYPDELAGHVDSYRDFLDRVEPKLAAPPELCIGNRTERYCGTLDVLLDMPAIPWNGAIIPPARWLLDLKTSRSGIFGDPTALQLCAYANAEVFVAENGDERPMSWLGVERCGALHVKRDGWELYPLETGPRVWAYFRYLAWLYHEQEAKKDWATLPAGPFPALASVPA